jgi:hypothetical protein
MRLESQKEHRKTFKLKKRNMGRVLNVKPYPIPDLEGESARIFEQQIREPPTKAQKRMMREGAIVFAKTKRK